MSDANERALRIGDREINESSDCFVIAEIGHNHQGSLEQCIEMFKKAAECGADAVKLQKRDNRSLYTRDYYNRPYDHENSYGSTYGEHREALEFGRAEYLELKQLADELGVVFMSTAFDVPSADFLAEIDIAAYKIASADLTNTPLLRHVASIGKPVVVSTGAAQMDDVVNAYEVISSINTNIAFCQCTASYPPEWDQIDLKVIETYRQIMPDTVIGFSGHDSGIAMSVAAYVLGARIVEKHFTLNRAMKGTDQAFSLEPQGMDKLVRDLRRMRVALGDGTKHVYQTESEPATKMGKKLVATADLPAGHVIGEDDVAAKSPGDGLPPTELERLIGRRLRYPVSEEQAFTFELCEEETPHRFVSDEATNGGAANGGQRVGAASAGDAG